MSYEYPPAGTMCADCGCCKAGVYAGSGADRVPICMACDLGEVCGPKRQQQPASAPATTDEPSTSIQAEESSTAEMTTDTESQTEPNEATEMADNMCKGGCGTTLPASNKSGFAWGHKSGCPKTPPPRTSEAEAEEVQAGEEVTLSLNESQLDRIWHSLPLEEKALAITVALTAQR